MTTWGFPIEPVFALFVVGILMVLLRWAFSPGHSLVQRRPRSGSVREYGLLVSVAEPKTFIEAEQLRRRLADAGLRVTLAPTTEGPRVLVFPEDERAARTLLRS